MSITIYTDGSSRGNPGRGGWGCVVSTQDSVTELGGREDHTTNNRMELTAAIHGLTATLGATEPVTVYSDSKYVIQGITVWVFGWQKNGWITAGKKEVENRDLWERLVEVTKGRLIEWRYIKGHAGHAGNERCDVIATSCADAESINLYVGSRKLYPIDLDAQSASLQTTGNKQKKSSGVKAYSYLSLVDGVLVKHATWTECEARVKGVRGARFKKSIHKDDEASIIKEWGI